MDEKGGFMSFDKKILLFMILMPPVLFLSTNFALAKSLPDMRINVAVDLNEKCLRGEIVTRFSLLKDEKILAGHTLIEDIETEDGEKLSYLVKKGIIRPKQTNIPGDSWIRIHFRWKPGSSWKEAFAADILTKRYILLSSNDWCPRLMGLATYRLTVEIDPSLIPVSESDDTISRERDGRKEVTFVFDHPRESITLAAARFYRFDSQKEGVRLSVYLLKNDEQLASRLINVLEKALDRYNRLISPYPYRSFQVIETPAPLGVTVPTMTLIGSQIIGKSFVTDTSLIHEFVHSWFGNSVFVDYSKGNWCEGLTTYMADYLLAEKKGLGLNYRHTILSEYKSYVHGNGFPIDSFRVRFDRKSKAIGYGKGAMIFHMLRNIFGDQAFFHAISVFSTKYRFKKASWQQIQELFSSLLHEDLDYFFKQWISRADVPEIKLTNCFKKKIGNEGFEIEAVLHQKNAIPYKIMVPIEIITENGNKKVFALLQKAEENIKLKTNSNPRALIVDPGFDIMRDLEPEEFPPCLSRLFGATRKVIILPKKKEGPIYSSAISFFKKQGFDTMPRNKLKHSMLKKASFLVFGTVEGRLKELTGADSSAKTGVVVRVRNNPLNGSHVVASIIASDKKQMDEAVRKIPHYGKYGLLRFEDGKIEEKREYPFERGIYQEATSEVTGIFSKDIEYTGKIAAKMKGYQVIYLGEKHDRQGIHQAQLKIIKAISKKGPVAVGMEMFQRPFQHVIDDYLKGRIDEKTFLKKSEYFKRWAFNYHFYRPIVEFCKKEHIPIVALNLQSEISKKIARNGLSALSEKERAKLPPDLDLKNEPYERYLRQIFRQHRNGDIDDFQHFYQAQIAWDETMAQSIADYIKTNPDRKMVVIVGGGHVEFGYGIPSRVKRRLPSISQLVAVFDPVSLTRPQMADLFLFAPDLPAPFTPKLGVLLEGNDKLKVESVVPESPGAQAGLKKGDKIVSVDGIRLKDIYDLKVELFFKKKGQKVTIEVERRDAEGRLKTIRLVTGRLEPFNWRNEIMNFHSRKARTTK